MIGDQGASALAAVLKETKITNLKCAAARAFAFMSTPIDTPHHPPPLPCSSLMCIKLGPEGGAALAEGLRGNSTLQSLEYAACGSNRLPSVRLSVSAR